MRLLLISNSTNPGEEYLDYPKNNIKTFLGEKPVKALFIPYAGVTVSFDDYEAKVKHRFNELGHDIVSIHHFDDPVKAVEEAEAIVVGGGSTWNLLHMVHKFNLTDAIRNKVIKGKMLNKYPSVLKLSEIEKWDGALSKFSGGNVVPFMNVQETN